MPSRDFDGVDDKCVLPVGASFKGLLAGTILLWYRPDAAPSPNAGLYYESTANTGFTRFGIFHLSTGDLQAIYRDTDSGTPFIVTETAPFTAGNFYCIAATVDSATDELFLFRSAANTPTLVQRASDLTAKGIMTAGNPADQIGIAGTDAAGFGFINGRIAAVQTFNRALSLAELNQIASYPGSVQRGKIALLPLWGGSPEGDYSGNGNSGTLTGTTVSAESPPVNGVFTIPKPRLEYAAALAAAAVTGPPVGSLALLGAGA